MKILIVDDNKENLYLLETLLKGNGYKVVLAMNGAEGLKKLGAENFDMIISDILMPVMDGFQFCRVVKKNDKLKDIPFVFYTATYTDEKDEELALKVGADKFIQKPIEPDKLIKIIQGVVKSIKKGKIELKVTDLKDEKEICKLYSVRLVKKLEKKMLDLEREIARREQAEQELRQSFNKLQRIMEETIQAIAAIIEVRDPYTAGHQRRVAQLALAIAKEMNLSEEEGYGIYKAAQIHDIGKISVPAEILNKPTRLTENEFNMIKTHSQVAYDILKTIEFPWPVAKIILQHHERMNGSGYPKGLKEKDILIGSKILAVADVVEAMSSHRPYRPAHSIDEALEEIVKNKGVLYYNKVADVCLNLFNKKKFKFE